MRLRVAAVRDPGLACLSGLLLIACFPGFDLDALAWVALVPLLLALEGKPAKAAYLLSGVTGVIFFVGIFSWIWSVRAYNLLDEILLAGYLAQYVSLWGLAVAWLRGRTGLPVVLIAPPVWVALEYVRSHLSFLSLPWMLLGHSQYSHPSLIQITSLAGVYGLSFLIVLTNVAVADALAHVRRRSAAPPPAPSGSSFPLASSTIACVLLIAVPSYGLIVLSEEIGGERLTIAVVQGNIPQERKWDEAYRRAIRDRYTALTRQAARTSPTLIVWPETAVPGDVSHDPELRRALGQLARETSSYLLIGSSPSAKFSDPKLKGRYYNSMALLAPSGRLVDAYQKLALVPFGESEPLQGIIRWPAAIASVMGNMVPGDRYTVFSVRGVALAATICWENIFPDLVREFVRRGAVLIVNATNEAWFDETAAPYQFLAMSVFRAAENRVAVVRSANTGISAFIDPFGRITQRLRGHDGKELFVEGILIGEVSVARRPTFYTRHGDLFAFVQIGGSALLLCYPWLARILRARRRASSPGA